MSKNSAFTGTGVAIVTPFNAKGEVDYKGLEKVLEHDWIVMVKAKRELARECGGC